MPCDRPARRLSLQIFCLQVDSDIRLDLASTCTSKTQPGLILKATFSKSGRRSEVGDGSGSQLPPSFPAAHTPYQRQENKRGGTQPFKRAHVWLCGAGDLNRAQLHVRIKGIAGCCISLVTLRSDLTALAVEFQHIPVSK